MKKLLITLSCIATVVLLIVAGKRTFTPNKFDTNNLALQNIEALAAGGDYDYPNGYPYTSTCNVSISKWKRCKVEVITCQGGGSGCNTKKCPVHPS